MSSTQKSIDNGETFLNDLLSAGSLSHYGVLGMHWGFRKPTDGGAEESADHKETSAIRKKPLSQLSTADIKKANTRAQAEKQFKELNPNSIAKGKKAAEGIFALAGTGASVAGLYNFVKSPAGQGIVNFGKTKGGAVLDAVKFGAFIIKHPVEG